jgi:hypothetical protein
MRIASSALQQIRFAVLNEMHFDTIGGKQNGPVTPQDLRAFAAKGELRRTDAIWKRGTPFREKGVALGRTIRALPPAPVNLSQPSSANMRNQIALVWAILCAVRLLAGTAFAGDPLDSPTEDPQTTAWIQAADRGDLAQLRQALESGTGVNRKLSNGNTALHIAALKGRTETVRWLISPTLRIGGGDLA